MEASDKKNGVEAQKDLEKAVAIYPRYAAAWYELGLLNRRNSSTTPEKRMGSR